MNSDIYLIAGLAFITTCLGMFYRFAWLRVLGLKPVPSGFGLILVLFFLPLFFLNLAFYQITILSIFLFGISVVIYWFDDAYGLPPIFRVILSVIIGCGLSYSFNVAETYPKIGYIWIVLSGGVFAFIFTNTLNFYDGADLNIAVLNMLVGLILVKYSMTGSEFYYIGILLLGFFLGFGNLNRKNETLYFGDSGCFLLAILFLYAVLSSIKFAVAPLEFLAALAFPLIDVIFVFAIRIYRKHDILTRHHLHLYQLIQNKYKKKYYLIPQIINVVIILCFLELIDIIHLERDIITISICVIFTIIHYLFLRFYLFGPTHFFNDGYEDDR